MDSTMDEMLKQMNKKREERLAKQKQQGIAELVDPARGPKLGAFASNDPDSHQKLKEEHLPVAAVVTPPPAPTAQESSKTK